MRRLRIGPLTGLAVALTVVWGGAALVLRAMASPEARVDAKFARADRAVFYRVNPGEALTLDLAAQAQELRLITHLLLPDGTAYVPEAQYVYGLELSFDHQGAPLPPVTLYARARQSKEGLTDGVWEREHAFALEQRTQIADAREFLVEVPIAARAAPGRVTLRYRGARGAALVRVSGRYERLQSLFVRSEQVRRAESRAERASALPWERLPLARQRELARVEWEPLSARGEVGKDFDTFTLYRTAFRLPLVEVAEAALSYLGPRRGVAINVRGPTTPLLRLWTDAATGGPDLDGPLELRARAWDGSELRWTLPRPRPGEVGAHPLELPPGLHSVLLVNDGEGELRYALEGDAAAWFAPDELRGPDPGPRSLLPHLVRSEAWAVGATCPSARLEVPVSAHPLGQLLRVDARALTAVDPAAAVILSLFDGKNRHVGDARLGLSGRPAPFDAVQTSSRTGTQVPCAAEAEGGKQDVWDATIRPLPVAEAVSGKLFLPREVTRVEVRAEAPAAVQLFSYLPADGEARLAPPYGELEPTAVRWLHAPANRRGWHPLRPGNHRALAEAGAELTLLRQIRLEPSGPESSSAAAGEAITLVPAGHPASQELLEPEREGREAARARTLYALLSPGTKLRAQFDPQSPGRPELRLQLEGSGGLGHEVEVLVDGEVVRRTTLGSTRTRTLLPPIHSGDREVQVRSVAPGLSAVLNRPPAEGESVPAHRSRTVYRLGAGGLKVPVVKRGRAAETLNIVVYAPQSVPDSPTRLSVSIDGGKPNRRTGVLVPRITRATREFQLEASGRPAGRVAGRVSERWFPQTVAVTLAEDLTPGTHWVWVRPDRPSPLWARFFVLGEPEPEEGFKQWNRPGWDAEEHP